MDIGLRGKHALITGASQGIGRATAEVLAALGARVTVIARSEGPLKEVVSGLSDPENDHAYRALDMADRGSLERTCVEVLKDRGAVHILVNNTGGPPPGPAHQAEPQAFLHAFEQHLIAYQVLVRGILPGMEKAGEGRIINVISTSVKQPLPGLGVSNTIRGAVANWAKTLAYELGPKGITVNNVLPGATGTERLAAIIRNKAAKLGISEEEAAEHMKAEIPLRRFAKPEEVAQAVAFLAGPAGSYINGINLPVDGGRTACL